ncbi:MAG: tetratricopeptide repeat protein [Acidimicrobiia bacterium]|nr:tetratricopeptide repeat protein [Acidimicrobiia bacterium]
MHPQEGSLLHLAEAVADGSDIDWDRAESSADEGAERDVIRQLRQLATVHAAARAQHVTWGALQIRGEVGKGSFGTVYRAWDTRLEREVALKLLDAGRAASSASTVIKEGRLLAQIRHANVVTVHGADSFDGRVGIWMEFVTGRTLKEIVTAQGPFGAHEAALIGRDLCRALAAVHKASFLHRDIKAQNVMREAGGRTVLMDFGAGEDASAAAQGSALSGTPAYLAPELLAGGAPSVQSDLYSLGVLLYFLVSGEFPVVGSSLDDFRAQHAQGKRRLLRDIRPDLPAAFVRVVDRATAANPADRPDSAGALEGLLDEALDVGDAAHSGRGVLSRRSLAAIAGLVLAAVGLLWLSGLPERWRLGPPPGNSVAVVPFSSVGSAAGVAAFSDGLPRDIAANLSTLGGVRVMTPPSAEDADAAVVLGGSVQVVGDRLRVIAQLSDGSTGQQLWSETFDRALDDLLGTQSEISRRVAMSVKAEVTPTALERGQIYASLSTESDLNRSIEAFEEALKLDPKSAAALAGLADAYTRMGTYAILPRKEAWAKAADAATAALRLDPSLADVHAALGYVQKNRFEWAAAEASFRRALELRPDDPEAHHRYGILLTQHGRFDEAITEIKAAIALRPLWFSHNAQLAATLMLARRYDDARKQAEETQRMDPSHPGPHQVLSEVYAFTGDHARAQAEVEQALQLGPLGRQDQELLADLGYIAARAGRRRDAEAVLDELAARERGGSSVAAASATVLAALGRKDAAFEQLSNALAADEFELGYLKVDPRWDHIRSDARFDALLRKLGFTAD